VEIPETLPVGDSLPFFGSPSLPFNTNYCPGGCDPNEYGIRFIDSTGSNSIIITNVPTDSESFKYYTVFFS